MVLLEYNYSYIALGNLHINLRFVTFIEIIPQNFARAINMRILSP